MYLFAFLFLLSFVANYIQAEPVLKQIHLITRHGSRMPLSKNAATLQESESSILTPIGQQEHFELGTWLRYRYMDIFPVFDLYDPSHVRVESSDLERTLVSASSLLLGLFPKQTRSDHILIPVTPANIPVYARQSRHDLNIRSYVNCPAFLNSLEDLYVSQQWVALEQQNMPLLKKMAQFPDFKAQTIGDYVPLKNIWNVFDLINVAETECLTKDADNETCKELPDPTIPKQLSDGEFATLEKLAGQAEILRYGPTTAGNRLGGPMWDTIAQRMQAETHTVVSGDQIIINRDATVTKFYFSSAHYPTLLGIISALGIKWTDVDSIMPDYAAALILEMYQDNQTFARSVKFYYKPGGDPDVLSVQVADDCPTQSDEGCPLEQFVKTLKTSRLSPEEWCKTCGNEEADVCMQLKISELQSCKASKEILAATYFGGLVTALVLWLLFILIRMCMCSTAGNKIEQEDKDVIMIQGMNEPGRTPDRPNNTSPTAQAEEQGPPTETDEEGFLA